MPVPSTLRRGPMCCSTPFWRGPAAGHDDMLNNHRSESVHLPSWHSLGDDMKPGINGILLPLLVAALGMGVAEGKECKGVSFPDQAQLEGSNLALNGLGMRQATAFKVNVYVAALYVAK